MLFSFQVIVIVGLELSDRVFAVIVIVAFANYWFAVYQDHGFRIFQQVTYNHYSNEKRIWLYFKYIVITVNVRIVDFEFLTIKLIR